MKTSRKLMTLGLAFGLLGSTGAFAKPAPYFENDRLSHEDKMVTGHVPATETSGATRYAHAPSTHAVQDDWPSDMLLD